MELKEALRDAREVELTVTGGDPGDRHPGRQPGRCGRHRRAFGEKYGADPVRDYYPTKDAFAEVPLS